MTDPEIAYNIFSKIISNSFVKKIRKNFQNNSDKKPWITKGILTSIKIRNKLIRKKGLFSKKFTSLKLNII